MAKASLKGKEIEMTPSEQDVKSSPQAQMAKYLNRTKADHYSLEPLRAAYKVSTGSLNLDMEIHGLTAGAVRVCGSPQTGKTPFLLNVIDNFLDVVPNSRAVWCKAEGRLSPENVKRVRHKVVYDIEQWEVGSIFVFRCNIYETWIGMMRDLITDNPTDCRYAFVTDSLDSLNLKNDFTKPLDEQNRVAGSPMLTKMMFQKMALAMNERGHMCFFVSQATAEIKLNPYDKSTPRQTGGSGGNSIAHNANEVLEFQEWFEGDLILEKPDEKHDRLKNRALGHNVRIKIKKSDTENRYVTVEIPIRYGQIHGNSIWREREIADQLLMWQLITKGGSWLSLTETLRLELEEKGGIDKARIPEKVQGMNQLYEYLDKNKDVTDYLFNKFKSLVSGT